MQSIVNQSKQGKQPRYTISGHFGPKQFPIHVIPPSSSGRLQEMSREICKNSSKMYHFLNKIQNLPEMNQEFSYIFYTFLKNLPEMEEKSPSFHFQTHHMYDFLLDCQTQHVYNAVASLHLLKMC